MNKLSEEEEKAIEKLKEYVLCKIDENGKIEKIGNAYKIVVLNLIEKQQKEIEELNQEKEYLNCIIESDKDNYINKDKIREIIYPSPDNYIPVEVQMSEMYRKIEKLLKESEINENNENY